MENFLPMFTTIIIAVNFWICQNYREETKKDFQTLEQKIDKLEITFKDYMGTLNKRLEMLEDKIK